MNLRSAAWSAFVKTHIPAYRLTQGHLPWILGRSRTVLVDHVGCKTGTKRTSALLYVADGDDVVVMGSKGGSHRHPAWYLNLREMDETEIQIGGDRRRVAVRQATAAERERLWPRAIEIWPDYERYQRRTEREIPLVILSPAAGQ